MTTSDTPETDANTWSDSSEGVLFKVVSVEFARRLERERDEAKIDAEQLANRLTALELESTSELAKLECERDEANEDLHKQLVQFDQLFDEAEKIRIERDEAREKIERQANRIRYLEGATNHACGTPLSVALRERDEAREEIKRLKVILDLIKKDLS